MSQYFAAMFRRRPNDGWFRVSHYDVTTVDIMTALAVASMFVKAFSEETFALLVFEGAAVRSGEVWRLVTWPIAEVPSFFAVISIAFFWSFGQQLEALFGRGRFLMWVLAVTIIPALTVTLLGLASDTFDFGGIEFGLGPLFLAGIWVYAGTYPNVRWFDVIPMWGIAAGFTVLQLLVLSDAGNTGAIVFLLLVVAAALSAGRSLGLASAWPIPHIPLNLDPNGRRRSRTRSVGRSKPPKAKRPKRGTSGQSVVEGPWKNDVPSRVPAPPSPAASPTDQIELDHLLDKISDQGMDALSGDEKQRLNELSKRLRNR
ncbi:DUF6576 domain-containing protein [Ilumatobacter nonamiensis]|uniref:DUF6576 domain-containing protein n=1 Tax=Ilumatobacter nonamiensis TaxID=467093 RepID=UPI00034C9292|nr:DUF6576 domain-containing protein [Ilumatobacter nonamiensis]